MKKELEGVATGELRVHFLDVGQGDSIFVSLPNPEIMLIDDGDNGLGPTVVKYPEGEGYSGVSYCGSHQGFVHLHNGLGHIDGFRKLDF